MPEVKRLDLAEVVLTLKASGVEEVRSFRCLEPPEPQALALGIANALVIAFAKQIF